MLAWQKSVMILVAVGFGSMSAAPPTAQTSDEVPRTAWGAPGPGWRLGLPKRDAARASRAVCRQAGADGGGSGRVERERAEWVERIDAAENASIPGNDIHTRVFLDFGTKTVADRRSSLIIDPPNGRKPPMAPEGERRPRNAGSFGSHPLESIDDFSLSDRCMATLGVPLNPLPYNSYVQLFQTEDHLVMLVEMMHTTRFIPIVDRPPGTIRQRRGESRATGRATRS